MTPCCRGLQHCCYCSQCCVCTVCLRLPLMMFGRSRHHHIVGCWPGVDAISHHESAASQAEEPRLRRWCAAAPFAPPWWSKPVIALRVICVLASAVCGGEDDSTLVGPPPCGRVLPKSWLPWSGAVSLMMAAMARGVGR